MIVVGVLAEWRCDHIRVWCAGLARVNERRLLPKRWLRRCLEHRFSGNWDSREDFCRRLRANGELTLSLAD